MSRVRKARKNKGVISGKLQVLYKPNDQYRYLATGNNFYTFLYT